MKVDIALGSNLGDRLHYLAEAKSALLALPNVQKHCVSSRIYESKPVACPDGTHHFLNAAMRIHYLGGGLLELLNGLQAIEQSLNRPPQRENNACRTIDLDVICAENLVLNHQRLILPHPRAHHRAFVLCPLADIEPSLILPGQAQTIAQLLDALPVNQCLELAGAAW